jgi:hypothetical protein
MSRERKRKHDDAHRPLTGKGARALTPTKRNCGDTHLLAYGVCVHCGRDFRQERNA